MADECMHAPPAEAGGADWLTDAEWATYPQRRRSGLAAWSDAGNAIVRFCSPVPRARGWNVAPMSLFLCVRGWHLADECADHGAPPVIPEALSDCWSLGSLDPYADGGYPLSYLADDGTEFCAHCATRELLRLEPGERGRPTMVSVNHEADTLSSCDECGALLEVSCPTDKQQGELDAQAAALGVS